MKKLLLMVTMAFILVGCSGGHDWKITKWENGIQYYWDEDKLAWKPVLSWDNESIKNVEGIGAERERHQLEGLAAKLIDKYGFSEERAKEISKMVNNFSQISSKRSLTETEKDTFSKNLLGINFQTAQEAVLNYNQGDFENYNSIIEKVSSKNGVAPEDINSLMEELFKK